MARVVHWISTIRSVSQVHMPRSRFFVATILIALASHSLGAQTPAGVTQREMASPVTGSSVLSVRPNGGNAFVLEALAGSLGSLAGIGAVLLSVDCGFDDLGCEILTAGAAGALGVVGATVATSLAARSTGSRRSAGGALLGAVVGTGVGLGVHWLVNQNSDRNIGDAVVLPIFVISQGTIAALGSRLLGSAP